MGFSKTNQIKFSMDSINKGEHHHSRIVKLKLQYWFDTDSQSYSDLKTILQSNSQKGYHLQFTLKLN